MVRLAGSLFNDAGEALASATVAIFPTSASADEDTSACSATATTTTSSAGAWSSTALAANTYDVRISSGTSIRWRRFADEIQLTRASFGDDAGIDLGTCSAQVILNRSSLFSADAELTGVIEGTSDHPGVAANSLIISNVTNDGDIMFAVSDGGNSKGLLKLCGANGKVVVHGGGLCVGAGLTSTASSNTLGATSFNDASITNVNDIALDSISADATDINVAVSDNSATALTVKQGSDAYLIIDTANSSESVAIGTGISGTAITLGHSTSEVTVADNLTVTGNMTVNGTTTTVNSTTLTVDDPTITLGGDSAPGSDDNKDRGVEFRYHDGSCARIGFFGYDDSAGVFTGFTAASNSSEVFSGTVINATFGDISGAALTVDDVNVNGKVVTMTGSACDTIVMTAAANGAFSLVTTDTAAAAANIQITADGTVDIDSAGVLTLDSGAAINIEPASGSAILLDGTISVDAGVVTGATSITSTAFVGTLSTVSQPNVTTLAGLTSLGVAGSTTNIVAGDVTMYNAVNDGNPTISLGAASAERLVITANYDSSAQTLCNVEFATAAASGTANKGKFVFDVDGTDIMTIDDGGIDIASGKTFAINGSDISTTDTTYSAGTLLDLSGTTFNVDLTEANAATIANGDYIVFLDGGTTGTQSKGNIHDVANLFAGTGLCASSSVINIAAAQTGITSLLACDIKIGEDDQTKVDFADANIINLHANNIKALSVHNTSSKGELRFYEGANYVGFAAPCLSGDQIWRLPTGKAGSACQVLTCDGCGVLSWASAGGARTVAGTTDNGIVTFVNSGSTFAAEAGLTFDATTLSIQTDTGTGNTAGLNIMNSGTASACRKSFIRFAQNRTTGGETATAWIYGNLSTISCSGYKGDLQFLTACNGAPSLAMKVLSCGDVQVKENSNLVSVTKGIAKAWMQFFHAVTIHSSYNSSITHTNTGVYTVTLTTNMENGDYAVAMAGSYDRLLVGSNGSQNTTSSLVLNTAQFDGTLINVPNCEAQTVGFAVYGEIT